MRGVNGSGVPTFFLSPLFGNFHQKEQKKKAHEAAMNGLMIVLLVKGEARVCFILTSACILDSPLR